MTAVCEPAVREAAGGRAPRWERGLNLGPRVAAAAPADAIVLRVSPDDDGKLEEVALALYGMARHGHLTVPVGIAGVPASLDATRTRLRDTLERRGPVDRDAVGRVLRALRPIEPGSRGIGQRPLYYLSLAPQAMARTLHEIATKHSSGRARVVLDKPFGHDLPTARALNRLLAQFFLERDVFRVDHYLSEGGIQKVLSFRRTRGWAETEWHRCHVSSVQITAADASLDGSGIDHAKLGVIRTLLHGDLLHLLSHVVMDLPASRDPESIRDARLAALKRVRCATPPHVVRGRVRHADGPAVAGRSDVETYAALRLQIDSERWAGVPFHVRAGWALPLTATEIVLCLRPGGYLRFRCEAAPGALEDILTDASRGFTARFSRHDHIEEGWRIVNAIVDEDGPLHAYEPGSWGPRAADRLIASAGRWLPLAHAARSARRSLSRSAQPARG